jgi:hypothetical protein
MWYYASAGDYEGPFQEAFIGRKLRAGVISKTTLVWRDGMAEWLPLAETELIHLITEQEPWQRRPTSPPPPPSSSQPQDESGAGKRGADHQDEEGHRRGPALEDYEQSGYERPQKGRPAPSHEEHSRANGPTASHGAPKAQKSNKRKAAPKAGPFQDLSSVTHVVTFLFALSALLSSFFLIQYVSSGTGHYQVHPWSPSEAIPLLQLIKLVGTVAGLTFLVWVYRALSNVPSLGARGTDLSPGWVIVSFFIPFFNLFIPYLAMRKLWQASFAPRAWAKQAVAPLVTFMWLAWVFGNDTWDTFVSTGATESHFILHDDYTTRISAPSLWPFFLGIAVDVMVIFFVRAVWQAQRTAHGGAQV